MMDNKIHSGFRVIDMEVGGALVFPTENLGETGKSITKPLGLTLWASEIDTKEW